MKLIMVAVVALVVSFFTVNSFAGGQHELSGVVQAIKSDTGKLTIKHGPIAGLGMSAMTMDFKVYDPSMLDEVKKGHKVTAMVEEDKNGNMVIMEIEDKGMASGAMSSSDDGHSHSHE